MRETHRSRSRTTVVVLTAAAFAAAALLAVTALTGWDDPGEAPSHGSASTRERAGAWDRSPDSVAAVGDSITRGFDACAVLTDCPEVSWATGSDRGVRSLALRLLGTGNTTRRSWNYAMSGARMSDLTRQMREAARQRPGLVTVLVGANDACRDSTALITPVAAYRAQFEKAMRTLRAKSPSTQVYVSSVPDLKRLWSTGRGDPLGRQIWKLGICASMLGDSENDSAPAQRRRDLVHNRVMAYNDVLKDVCGKDTRCRWDGGAVFNYRFSSTQLSQWDWFHPSRKGQARLAEIAYRQVTALSHPH